MGDKQSIGEMRDLALRRQRFATDAERSMASLALSLIAYIDELEKRADNIEARLRQLEWLKGVR